MSLSNIVINDGKATPVAHTFKPRSQNGLVTVWKDSDTNDTAAGEPRLTASISDPMRVAETDVVEIRLSLPEEVTDSNGFTRVAHTPLGVCTFKLPRTAGAVLRKDLRVLMVNALQHASIAPYIDDLKPEI